MNALTPVTEHFSAEEFACKDSARTSYPSEWIGDRLTVLCRVLEVVRAAHGGPLYIVSGYRTPAFNATLAAKSAGVAKVSQHIQGRAADISLLPNCYAVSPDEIAKFHATIRGLFDAGQLPSLGGLGVYPHWVHLDIRAKTDGRLATWTGAGFGSEQ